MTETAAPTTYRRTTEAQLTRFTRAVFERVGVPGPDAAIAADVLVAADMRGIESHGVARLAARYVDPLRRGDITAVAAPTVVHESATSLVLDASNGLGQPASVRAMRAVIAKAARMGTAFGAVRNSNHFGIAGYYAMLALDDDMIGIASTNTPAFAIPTFGTAALLGTNPWAYAVPAGNEPPFVLDFATTTVSRGRLETCARSARALEPGWAVDAAGGETLDAVSALAGALLPLGGYGTEHGGHKGYGLGLFAEIVCALLAGGPFAGTPGTPGTPGTSVTSVVPGALGALGDPDDPDDSDHPGAPGADEPGEPREPDESGKPREPDESGKPRRGPISHFFGAIKIAALRDLAAFKADMDRELRAFKDSERAPGFDRIYVAGEREHEATLAHRADGVPLHPAVWDDLERLGRELGVPADLARPCP